MEMDGQKNMGQVVMEMLAGNRALFRSNVKNVVELGKYKNG
jgi:hypothetical protein